MNISGLIRNLVGDLQASDSKVLELKVGQVVKGVVLQLLSDQEALINIGGVQVRAKLETPLKQGDVTLLQVQPESSGGQIMLKPLSSSDVQITDESMANLLKAFQLKDTAPNRQMIQQMQQGGVPLTKETVQAFTTLQSAIPEGVTKEEWDQAGVLAFKRALPLTPDTVNALRQATSGAPMGDVLEKLEQQVTALLREQPSLKSADTLAQVVSVLKELRVTAAAVWTARPPEQAAPGAPAPAAAQQPAPGAGTPAAVASPAAASLTSAAPRAEAAPAATPAQPAAPSSAAPLRAAEGGLTQARSAEPGPKGEPPQAGSPVKAAPAEAASPKAAAQPQGTAAAAAPEQQVAETDPNWISRLLKSVGVEHENQLAKLAEKPEALLPLKTKEDASLPSLSMLEPSVDSDGVQKPVADTLKSLLMQMTASNDLPAPLKESAQQALQQITGQQLLLTNDRASMFSHMTLFVPFMDGSGQQSAAVHIQSRKGSRGEIDANNCRLLFDLQMKAMGNTLVDVQVVNRIVSLHVHNDHPLIASLMEGSKEEIAAALNKVGYQFVSLKTSPFPEITAAKDNGSSKTNSSDGSRLDVQSFYQPKTYKGVDFRV